MTEPEAIGASSNAMGEFLQRLINAQELTGMETSLELAEALWLATHLEPAREPASSEEDILFDLPEDGPDTADTDRLPETPQTPSSDEASPRQPPPEPKAEILAPPPQALPPQVLPIQLADPAMLTNPLAIIRALRPLLQKVDAGTGSRLDESATVDFIARTRLCLPIMAPEREPWFDVILVVDRSASMHIWQRLLQDVVLTLQRYGAFRNVQVFDLQVDAAAPVEADRVLLSSHPERPPHRPKELIDQQGRRIAILLSDCAAPYWWQGTLLPMLQIFGSHMPTVLWHMLPPYMWQRTALGRGNPVTLRSDTPGVANQRLQIQMQPGDEPGDAERQFPLPVTTGNIADLTRWGVLVAGGRQLVPGVLLPDPRQSHSSNQFSVPRNQTLEDLARAQAGGQDEAAYLRALKAIAEKRVQRFLQLASPQAQRLLMLLAAAPVITMPVVRLICDVMLPNVQLPLPLAEVFLSGLLQRLPGQEESLLKDIQHAEQEQNQVLLATQDWVQYGFVPQARETLLEKQGLYPIETVQVINLISAAIEQRWHRVSPYTFQAVLKDPEVPLPEGLEGAKTFARITADILETLGRPYEALVQQLKRGADKVPVLVDPYGRVLQRFDYEVAEYLDFPAIEPFDFFEGQFRTFPPALEPAEFTVLTVEIAPTAPITQGLELFDFTVATLTRSDETEEWSIHREPHQAHRYLEPLSDTQPLEMVNIPGGTFTMGSPDDELERRPTEGPQHGVTLAPFFMGRYPITQAQWRVVAALPQVEQDLNPHPSSFEGDTRPVEQVSWDDAVEFCARLSAHTGREYRLPTEAEWEYACRAGTTTPFHFGETITTHIANPKGGYRSETTPVDQFEGANGFGLHDMHGNVLEWCQDHWHKTYKGAPTDGSAWLEGGDANRRILRGGSWNCIPGSCRSAYRRGNKPDHRGRNIGFRVVCTASRKQAISRKQAMGEGITLEAATSINTWSQT